MLSGKFKVLFVLVSLLFLWTIYYVINSDFYVFTEDKDFLKKNLLQLKKKSLSKDVTQQSNASKAKRSTTSKPNTTTSSSAAIATKSKPLSLNQTAWEDDDHTKKTRSRRNLDFYQAESAAGIGDKENDGDQTTSTSLEKDDAARIKRRLEQVSYIRLILFK